MIEGRWREPGLRYHACIHGTREREHGDVFGTGVEEDFGAFVGCGAGGEDIVDEQDALAGDLPWGMQGECLVKVLQACRAGERGLGVGIDDANQVSIGYGSPKYRSDAVGEQEGLIEFSLSKAVGVERDRHEKIRVQICGKSLGEQRTQRIRQHHLSAIFEEGNGLLERCAVGIGGPYLRIVRCAGTAVMTFVSRAMGCRERGGERAVASRAGGPL